MDDAVPERDGTVQGKAAVWRRVRRHQVRQVLPYGRSMFEAVARSAAGNPYVVVAGMPIDEEVAARRVLVLTHPALDDRRVGEPWQPTSEPGAGLTNAFGVHNPIAGVGVEARAVRIDADLDAAVLEIGNGVEARREIDEGRRLTCAEP